MKYRKFGSLDWEVSVLGFGAMRLPIIGKDPSHVDELKAIEMIRQKEKLASLGVLVSSIAHEINNPNNFVSFNIPILRDYINELIPIIEEYTAGCAEIEICHLKFSEFRQDIFKLLDNLENGSNRISAFVSNLRGFSQNKDMRPLIWVDIKGCD